MLGLVFPFCRYVCTLDFLWHISILSYLPPAIYRNRLLQVRHHILGLWALLSNFSCWHRLRNRLTPRSKAQNPALRPSAQLGRSKQTCVIVLCSKTFKILISRTKGSEMLYIQHHPDSSLPLSAVYSPSLLLPTLSAACQQCAFPINCVTTYPHPKQLNMLLIRLSSL